MSDIIPLANRLIQLVVLKGVREISLKSSQATIIKVYYIYYWAFIVMQSFELSRMGLIIQTLMSQNKQMSNCA